MDELIDEQTPIEPTSPPPGEKNNLAIPAAIVFAGFLIALAVMYTGRGQTLAPTENKNPAAASGITVKSVTPGEHIFGNPSAPVKIVEYSDLECPFCKQFHVTMRQIMNDYKDGQIAWVYRQLPLDSLHSKARREAEASECAAKLGGNDKFWEFINRVFEITPSNNGLDLSLLPEIADYVGLNRKDFENCLNSGEFKKTIDNSIAEATAAGAQGTPYSIVLGPNGQQIVVNGAQPYAFVKQAVDSILAKK